jgi:hypothetical protein
MTAKKKAKISGPSKLTVELCVGSYLAQQFGKTVSLVATGAHPTSGFDSFLQQSPLDVFPPEFTLWHKVPTGIVLQVVTPFSVSAHFAAAESVNAITVHDADGVHQVKVEQAPNAVQQHLLDLRRDVPSGKRTKRTTKRQRPAAILAAASALVSGCVQVWVHLEPILKPWCGSGSVFPSSNLQSLWTQGPTGKPYDPYGINSLISAIQADAFFTSCPEAKGLRLGHFQAGGEIQIVDDLTRHLCPCAS